MNYDDINVDEVLAEIDTAIDKGDYRQATKQETMKVRLAALAPLSATYKKLSKKTHNLLTLDLCKRTKRYGGIEHVDDMGNGRSRTFGNGRDVIWLVA